MKGLQKWEPYLRDIETLGQVLYTYYLLYFLIAGIILLVAMIGAIVLTLNLKKKSKIQIIYKQVTRNFNEAIFLITTKKKWKLFCNYFDFLKLINLLH